MSEPGDDAPAEPVTAGEGTASAPEARGSVTGAPRPSADLIDRLYWWLVRRGWRFRE